MKPSRCFDIPWSARPKNLRNFTGHECQFGIKRKSVQLLQSINGNERFQPKLIFYCHDRFINQIIWREQV